ncbi:MAG: FAD binding domain-containing protein [Butyrivibrio sp.]|nr:FAD binding domain-containing protein [Butyrivibrio sp.]
MLKIKQFVKVSSIEEAYELNQQKNNIVIGGMLWLKMQDRIINTAIDMSGLGLDKIEENDAEFRLGAMVTLRDMETHKSINEYFGNAICDAVKNIVGVQFRNLATVGGSVFGRYGFSDVLTVLMALNAKVELYSQGIMSIEEFAAKPYDNDILLHVIIPKENRKARYSSVRNQSTDFPVITCGVSASQDDYRIVIGARPARAVAFSFERNTKLQEMLDEIDKKLVTESNNRADADYRHRVALVLARRSLSEL